MNGIEYFKLRFEFPGFGIRPHVAASIHKICCSHASVFIILYILFYRSAIITLIGEKDTNRVLSFTLFFPVGLLSFSLSKSSSSNLFTSILSRKVYTCSWYWLITFSVWLSAVENDTKRRIVFFLDGDLAIFPLARNPSFSLFNSSRFLFKDNSLAVKFCTILESA